jgi:hypothetical protein
MRTGSIMRPVHPKVPSEAEATIAPVMLAAILAARLAQHARAIKHKCSIERGPTAQLGQAQSVMLP